MGAGFRDAALDTARNQRTASCRLHIQIAGQLKAHGDKRFQAETGEKEGTIKAILQDNMGAFLPWQHSITACFSVHSILSVSKPVCRHGVQQRPPAQ